MKNTVVKISKKQERVNIVIPRGQFRSDWFRCLSCGHEERKKVLGNFGTCGECGGTMVRI